MSTPRTTADSTSKPSGAVPLIERQRSHAAFLDKANPSAILLKLDAVRALVNDGETAVDWTPAETTVITTSTVNDEELAKWNWEREYNIINQFEPDYHIPTDYPVYNTHSQAQRLERTRHAAIGAEWMAGGLEDTQTDIIPLIKGKRPEERAIGFETATEIGTDLVAFYGTQYLSGGGGANLTSLVDTITEIATAAPDGMELFVIGLLSPTYLRRLPGNVRAAAGLNQWRKAIPRPGQDESQIVRDQYHEFETDVRSALSWFQKSGHSPDLPDI